MVLQTVMSSICGPGWAPCLSLSSGDAKLVPTKKQLCLGVVDSQPYINPIQEQVVPGVRESEKHQRSDGGRTKNVQSAPRKQPIAPAPKKSARTRSTRPGRGTRCVRPKTRLTSAMADPPTTCAPIANLRCRSMSMPGAYCVCKDWTIWAVRFFWKPRDGVGNGSDIFTILANLAYPPKGRMRRSQVRWHCCLDPKIPRS